MTGRANKQRVMNSLKKELSRDKLKTRIYGMSELGLVQITRKRSRLSLTRVLFDPCLICKGTGYLPSIKDTTSRMEQTLLSIPRGKKIKIKAQDVIIEHLRTAECNRLRRIMRMKRIRVELESSPDVKYGELILTDLDTEKQYKLER